MNFFTENPNPFFFVARGGGACGGGGGSGRGPE